MTFYYIKKYLKMSNNDYFNFIKYPDVKTQLKEIKTQLKRIDRSIDNLYEDLDKITDLLIRINSQREIGSNK